MFTVYVLRNEHSSKIYIGQTNNFEKRIKQHNDENFDRRSYTSLNRGIWVLVYKEQFLTRREARIREKQLKSSRGRNFIKTKILGV